MGKAKTGVWNGKSGSGSTSGARNDSSTRDGSDDGSPACSDPSQDDDGVNAIDEAGRPCRLQKWTKFLKRSREGRGTAKEHGQTRRKGAA